MADKTDAGKKTILVTGGNGQAGFELRRSLAPLGQVLAPDRQELDLSDAAAVDAWLECHTPGLIVNAAAYTAVDKAEDEPEFARRLNAELPAQLAAYCARHGKWLVHYSSDYVYSGEGDISWQEEAVTAPVNTYGATKRDGDVAVAQGGSEHLILRTSWVYSAPGKNFVNTMLRLGAEREALSVVADQIGTPTPARLIAQITALALAPWGHNGCAAVASGVYHLAPRGETSWCEVARATFVEAARLGVPLAITPEAVAPIATADYPTPARRPLNSRLDVSKLESALGVTLPDWREALTLTLEEITV
ncbi:dTDP-4-dehydrorhamnose reductase [Vreelandella jeotgali]|uniref:dTDP-4-dehydrorhamnose reductase n=1 Tax=Vreelandella jeotgali TaxID=553386 RepID=UPI0003497112|nr:dTDP-4-dehydrorhamnose reductase [Halomonas jeotgali]